MTYAVKGKVQGSKSGNLGKQDAYRISMNVLWVMLAAGATSALTYIPDLPHNTPTLMLEMTVITSMLQLAQKYFSDTRNIPVVGSDSMEKVPDATEPHAHYYNLTEKPKKGA